MTKYINITVKGINVSESYPVSQPVTNGKGGQITTSRLIWPGQAQKTPIERHAEKAVLLRKQPLTQVSLDLRLCID